MNVWPRAARRIWDLLCLAVKKFMQVDGTQWAGAFAHYAFFSLFPLVILFVTIASLFIDHEQAGREIITYLRTYVPIGGDKQDFVFNTISGVVNARGPASFVALLMLGWSAMSCFTTLICVTNRAWGLDLHNWWQLPLKSLVFLAVMVGTVLLSIAVPVVAKTAVDALFPENPFSSWLFEVADMVVPTLVVFISLSLFYRLAPRRPTRFSEVWTAALCATLLLRATETVFVFYLKNFATLNAVYGAFGGIIAMLMWIYLSGCIFIFGACLCAARAEGRPGPTAKPVTEPEEPKVPTIPQL